MTCALTGPLQIQDIKAISGPEGHEVFSERKGLSLFQNKVLYCFTCIDAYLSNILPISSVNNSMLRNPVLPVQTRMLLHAAAAVIVQLRTVSGLLCRRFE